MEFCEFVKGIDFFGKLSEFYIKGKPKKTSFFGRIFTAIFVIIYVIILIYKFDRMIKRVEDTYSDSILNIEGNPEIKVTNDNFSIFLTVFDNSQPFIDETIYYIKAYYLGDKS